MKLRRRMAVTASLMLTLFVGAVGGGDLRKGDSAAPIVELGASPTPGAGEAVPWERLPYQHHPQRGRAVRDRQHRGLSR